jgi:eukaryotic-like serine/threonine-protein kinase
MKNKNGKKYLPYLWIFIGFCAFWIIVFIIIDSYILPSAIHNINKTEVPDVKGLSLKEAKTKIESHDLKYKIVNEQYNEEYPKGHIINQSPKARSIVKEKRHINLTVSKGGEIVIMPNITKRSLRFARVNLMQRGLYIGNIDYVFSDSIGVDTIISQSHSPGKQVPFGSYINLVVSKGLEAEIEVPNLTGKTLTQAEQLLESLELELGIISSTYDEIYAATYFRNTIVDQFPQPGELVTKNTKVDITIFR